MTIHVVGTSHVISMMRSLQQTYQSERVERFCFYYANNSAYQKGKFFITDNGIGHSAEEVSDSWEKSSGSRILIAHKDDTLVAFGFDEFHDKYAFLTQPEISLSSACRSQLLDDVAINACLSSLLVAVKQTTYNIIVVDPPLFDKSLQLKKFGQRLIHRGRHIEVQESLAQYLENIGVRHIKQPVDTLDSQGNFAFSKPECILPDGFHWSRSGILTVLQALFNELDIDELSHTNMVGPVGGN